MPRAAAVLLAAGDGRRAGGATNKVLLPLAGQPVFTWSVDVARARPEVTRVLLVIREQDRDEVARHVDQDVEVLLGGTTRHGSEWAALQLLAPAIEAGELDVVVIHDAARPLAGPGTWSRVIATAAEHGAAIPGVPHGHLAAIDGAEPPPDRLVAVQTPQAFAARPLLAAYRRAETDGFVGTDTASCFERYAGIPVRCVPGEPGNLKITFPDDVRLAERLLLSGR